MLLSIIASDPDKEGQPETVLVTSVQDSNIPVPNVGDLVELDNVWREIAGRSFQFNEDSITVALYLKSGIATILKTAQALPKSKDS